MEAPCQREISEGRGSGEGASLLLLDDKVCYRLPSAPRVSRTTTPELCRCAIAVLIRESRQAPLRRDVRFPALARLLDPFPHLRQHRFRGALAGFDQLLRALEGIPRNIAHPRLHHRVTVATPLR